MKKPSLRWKTLVPLALLAAGLSVAASSSFASNRAGVVRVAIMTDCKGAFGFGYEPDIGGAEAAFATYTLGQVTKISGFSGIGGINRYTPGWIGDILAHPNRLYYLALGVAIAVYILIRYVVRTPFGLTLQGTRDEPLRMGSLGYNVPLHRTLAFGFAAFLASLAGVLYVWWSGQIAPGNVDLPETINLLVMAVIGGLVRIEGAWLGAFVFIVIQNYVRDFAVPGLSFGGTLFGGSFNTIVGIIFLVIVLASPAGLMGAWDRVVAELSRRRGPLRTADEPAPGPGS